MKIKFDKRLFLFLAVGLMMAACVNNKFWTRLETKIAAGTTTVFFHELTDYEWDMVCVLPAYALDIGGRGKRVKQYIPYDLGRFEGKIPHLSGDGQWAFAFIADNRMVAIEKKGRGYYLDTDHKIIGKNCIDSTKAKFVKVDGHRNSNNFLIITDKQNWRKK